MRDKQLKGWETAAEGTWSESSLSERDLAQRKPVQEEQKVCAGKGTRGGGLSWDDFS